MPLKSGTSLSILVVILCLGVNVVLYPEVRGMLRDREVGSGSVASDLTEDIEKVAPLEDPLDAFFPEPPKSMVLERKTTNVQQPIPFETDPPSRLDSVPSTVTPKPLTRGDIPVRVAVEESNLTVIPEVTALPTVPETMVFEKKSTPSPPRDASQESNDDSFGLPSVFPSGPAQPLPETNPTSAFRPVVPAGMEEDYRRVSEGKSHQLELFSQHQKADSSRPVPTSQRETATPFYADEFKARRSTTASPHGLPMWETIEMADERAISTAP